MLRSVKAGRGINRGALGRSPVSEEPERPGRFRLEDFFKPAPPTMGDRLKARWERTSLGKRFAESETRWGWFFVVNLAILAAFVCWITHFVGFCLYELAHPTTSPERAGIPEFLQNRAARLPVEPISLVPAVFPYGLVWFWRALLCRHPSPRRRSCPLVALQQEAPRATSLRVRVPRYYAILVLGVRLLRKDAHSVARAVGERPHLSRELRI
jgi:hypothetical protein